MGRPVSLISNLLLPSSLDHHGQTKTPAPLTNAAVLLSAARSPYSFSILLRAARSLSGISVFLRAAGPRTVSPADPRPGGLPQVVLEQAGLLAIRIKILICPL